MNATRKEKNAGFGIGAVSKFDCVRRHRNKLKRTQQAGFLTFATRKSICEVSDCGAGATHRA
jgi:hypothetical protein